MTHALDAAVRPAATSGRMRDVLEAAQAWLRASLSLFDAETRRREALDDLAALDLTRYAIERSEESAEHRAAALARVAYGDPEGIATWVRGLFWDGIAMRSSIDCPCGVGSMRYVQSCAAHELALECDWCGRQQSADDGSWTLRPCEAATIETLRRAGVLPAE